MFGKAKEQLEFVKKAREIQKKLRDTSVEAESGAVKIKMNGEQKITSVDIDPEDFDGDDLNKLEKDIQSAVESAISKSQKIAAEMMKDMGGLGALGL
jgi:DNA-binding YbaB/EbfC family protein